MWRGRCGYRQRPVWSSANMRIWLNVVSILTHCQRRWTNIETKLGQVLVFAGRAVSVLKRAGRLCLVGTGYGVICVHKHLLKDVWMFLQHWGTGWCSRPSVEQTFGAAGGIPLINPFPQQLRAAAIDVTMWLLWTCRLRWSVAYLLSILWYAVNKLVYMAVYVLYVWVCFIFFNVFTLFFLYFCILFKISRLYSFI